jgi:hypothetical protein
VNSKRISRRTLLRGAGVAVALPSLEIMMHTSAVRAAPTPPPKRFCMSWIGTATAPSNNGNIEGVTPTAQGTGWVVPRSLKALTTYGLAGQVSVVSNLLIPWTSGTPGPGEKGNLVHFNTMGPQLAGTRGAEGMKASKPTGTTADQLVADQIAGNTTFKTLFYKMQAAGYIGGSNVEQGRQSWRKAANGTMSSIDPFSSPLLAYNSLFSGVTLPSANPADAAKAAFLLKQRRSVLDLVGDDLDRLKTQVGAADRQRIDKHTEEIRALEARISNTMMVGGSAACTKPASPGADPGRPSSYYYSGEVERSAVFSDLIAMAFACDLSRVASYMITHNKCWMGTPPSFPHAREVAEIHQMSHQGAPIAFVDAVGYLIQQWALMLSKLKAKVEPDGTTLLDNTAAVLVFEAGHGQDSEIPSKRDSAHSTENMTILIGGGAGGLRKGTHVRTQQLHPAKAVLTAMRAAGYTGMSLGEVSGVVPGLL